MNITNLSDFTALGVAAFSLFVLWTFVKGQKKNGNGSIKKQLDAIEGNHLDTLQKTLDRLEMTMTRLEDKLEEIKFLIIKK